jgi:bifunctional DNA-binding transcriptional regulator/antitoxin component of YhaV-PrlF toxin-antitoxin module
MTDTKAAEYTLRIAGKRQVTLPKGLVDALKLKKDDEFQIVMNTPTDIRLVPYARIRKDLLTPEVEEILKQRRAEIERGEGISHEDLLKRAAGKNLVRRLKSRKKSGPSEPVNYRHERDFA